MFSYHRFGIVTIDNGSSQKDSDCKFAQKVRQLKTNVDLSKKILYNLYRIVHNKGSLLSVNIRTTGG